MLGILESNFTPRPFDLEDAEKRIDHPNLLMLATTLYHLKLLEILPF